MHIPDGILTLQVSIATITTSVGFIALTSSRLKKYLDQNNIHKYCLTAMLIFSLQMININVTHGTSGHFLGAALATLLFGPYIGVLIMSSVLLTQAILFADGGYMALGSNILNMGIVGCFSAYFTNMFLSSVLPANKISKYFCIAIVSWFSVVMASSVCSIELSFSGIASPFDIFSNMIGIHNLIGILEAATTSLLFVIIYELNRKGLLVKNQEL